jgi:hypothetical protein
MPADPDQSRAAGRTSTASAWRVVEAPLSNRCCTCVACRSITPVHTALVYLPVHGHQSQLPPPVATGADHIRNPTRAGCMPAVSGATQSYCVPTRHQVAILALQGAHPSPAGRKSSPHLPESLVNERCTVDTTRIM